MILHQLSSCWTGSSLRSQQSVTFPFSKHIPLTEMFSVQQSTELVVTPARCDNTIHDGFAFSACTFLYKKKKKIFSSQSVRQRKTNQQDFQKTCLSLTNIMLSVKADQLYITAFREAGS